MKTIVCLLMCLMSGMGIVRAGADPGPDGSPARYQLEVTSPPPESRFKNGEAITIRAVAVDREDAVYSLEFLADGVPIGMSTIATLVPLPPGTPVDHEWVWADAAPGPHELQVRVPDPGASAVSRPVRIYVGDVPEAARVRLLQPADGAEFHSPASVELEAEAVDPGGLLDVVEFLANGAWVGTSRVILCPPCDEPPCPLAPCIIPAAGTPLIHRFVWERPPEGKYQIEARAVRPNDSIVVSDSVQIAVRRPVSEALLSWTAPLEGSVWTTPGRVPLEVTAVDPDGEIRRVEFHAGGSLIGVSEIRTREVEIPGRPRTHSFAWTNPPPGTLALEALAVSRAGAPVTSGIRSIDVQGSLQTPVVWVETLDAEAVEGNRFTDGADGTDGPADVLHFRIHRRGGPERDLQVFYQMAGDATAGEDYPSPSGSVSLPLGATGADVVIHPWDEGVAEGDERVILTLVPSPAAGPTEPYRIDPQRGQARGVIHDGVSMIPVVTVSPGRVYALEGDRLNRGELVLRRQGDLSQELWIQFAIGGQAIRGEDYRLLRNPCDSCSKPEEEILGDAVWMSAGEATVTLVVDGLYDGMLDRAEPVMESVEFQVLTPPIPAVVGARPPYVAGNPDRGVVHVVERFTQDQAELVLIQPAAGTILPLGIANEVRALGVDPQGSVRRMELFANGARVAVSEITTEEVDVPGRLREHRFQWWVTDAQQAGPYELEVTARNAAGQEIRSSKVAVTLSGESPDLPVVTVVAGKTPALEQGDQRSRTGSFVFHRKGGELPAATVFVAVGGTAQLGNDYRWNPGPEFDPALLPPVFGVFLPVNFEKGAEESTLTLTALPDGVGEGPEVVRVEVIAPPILALDAAGTISWPFPTYRIGEPRDAEVVIEDADVLEPAVQIVQPLSNTRFAAGQPVEIVATAVHPDAAIHAIQFLADGEVVGTAEYCCGVCDCAGPIPGRPFTGRVEWRGAAVGSHVLTARAFLGPNRVLESPSVSIHVVEASVATLTMVTPPNGAVLPLGVPVEIDTVGQDPAGLVSQVEFFANDVKIGETCFLCAAFGDFPPGTPLHNHIEWTPATPGEYVLTAVGQFGADHRIASPPVQVTVRRETGLGRLTIVTPRDGEQVPAGIPVPVVVVGVGRFGGITDVRLLVDGQPAGESRIVFIRPPEADEEVRHEFEVTLSPGSHVLEAQDLADAAVISPPVTVVAGESAGQIIWIAPAEDARFAEGDPIPLEVEAVNPGGLLFQVEFLANGEKIGESLFSCPQCRLRPGARIPHSFVWTQAPAGRHILSARAAQADGTYVLSSPRAIEVLPDTPRALEVVRRLPKTYEAGTPFTVQLLVTPRPEVAAYVVEELPPFALPAPGTPGQEDSPFWNVVNVSDGGVLDPLTGKVKFGPFLDPQPRRLTYEMVPNRTVDVARFEGAGIADGVAFPTGGDRELRASVRHPADRDPGDDSLSATELTAYAAAWQREQTWPMGPNPIPVDYVTRAAALWVGGERYAYDANAGPPPFCWINGGTNDAGEEQSPPPNPLGGLALRKEESLADGTRRVTLRVVPAPGVRAFAVEETLPGVGAPVSVISDGVYSLGSRVLRWGPFYGQIPVELGYSIAGGAGDSTGRGVASFDGQSVAVRDDVQALDDTVPRLVGVDDLQDGSRLVTLESGAASPGSYELQVSTDLKHWTPVGNFNGSTLTGFLRDTGAADSAARFYRAVQR